MILTPGITTNTARTLDCRLALVRLVRRRFIATLVLIAGAVFAVLPAAPQETASGPPSSPTVKQITSDLYFLLEYDGSNSAFLVTDEGVLVIDTRTHPRLGQDLIDRIRKVTNKPIKWVINTHFHGDHNLGNAPFKAIGATFVAQEETARIMKQVYPKEMARRTGGFVKNHYDPNEAKLILADVTFDTEMTIYLGGREVRLFYLGPGQNPGDTFVLFPQERVLFTPGGVVNHSIANMSFTPSVDNWIKLVDQIAARNDYDRFLPAHGDVGNHEDVREFAAYLRDVYSTVKGAVEKGMTPQEAQQKFTFPQYKDWRGYERMKDGTTINALYELIQTGQRSYFQ